jgi:CRP/FNR family cyclic AMP-dependent transcriptional regulator
MSQLSTLRSEGIKTSAVSDIAESCPDSASGPSDIAESRSGSTCGSGDRQSSAKAARTRSPLSEPISKPSEHQHRLRSSTRKEPKAGMGFLPESSRLLSGLPNHLSTELFARAKLVRLAADEVLFLSGDAGNGCYHIEEGLLKVTMVSRSGTERILAFLGPGAIVGELSVIDGQPRSASVVAVRDAKLSFLSRATFNAFAKKHPQLYKSLVTLCARRLRETDLVVAAESFLTLRGRVARTLLELAERFGQEVGSGRIVIRQKIGQVDLAAMAGIARENVSRILSEWKRRKVVSRLSGYWCIENKVQLERQLEL